MYRSGQPRVNGGRTARESSGAPGSSTGTLVAMAMPEPGPNPDALPLADPPRVHRCHVNGTTLHAELRGSGPALLIIHGGGEDAEVWRPVAERLEAFTVVTYDRRGTLRSGRDDWPGRGSAQHADDAAALLHVLQLDGCVVFGSSSAGVIALQLALRHPVLVPRALVFEPGLFRQLPGGASTLSPVWHAIDDHLAARPGDWLGALAAFRGAVSAAIGPAADELVAPSPGKAWYASREEENAEAFVRDDLLILTRERVDEVALASAVVDVRFSYGTHSIPVFRAIATQLAAVRNAHPIAVDGVSHLIYHHPDAAAAHLRTQGGDRPGGRRTDVDPPCLVARARLNPSARAKTTAAWTQGSGQPADDRGPEGPRQQVEHRTIRTGRHGLREMRRPRFRRLPVRDVDQQVRVVE